MQFSTIGFVFFVAAEILTGGEPPTVERPPTGEVIAKPNTSLNFVGESANGISNSINIDGAQLRPSSTVIRNSRNGFGNRIVVDGVEVEPEAPFSGVPTKIWNSRFRVLKNGRVRRAHAINALQMRQLLRQFEAELHNPGEKAELEMDAQPGGAKQSKVGEIINDPLMKMFMPPRAMEVLKAIHRDSSVPLNETNQPH